MNYIEEHSELFDSYLSGNLSGTELSAFEKRLADEKAFAEAFNVHRILVEGIRDHGRRDMKAFLAENARVDIPKGGFGAKKILYAAAAVFTLFAGLYAVMNFYSANKPENMAQVKEASQEQSLDSVSLQVPPALAEALSKSETKGMELQSERMEEEINAPPVAMEDMSPAAKADAGDVFTGYGTVELSTTEDKEIKVATDRKLRDTMISIPVLFAMLDNEDKMVKTVESASSNKISNRAYTSKSSKKESIILPQNNMSNQAGGINYDNNNSRQDTVTYKALDKDGKFKSKADIDPSRRSYNIEYWVSPINFRGYKFSGNTIQLYGIGSSIAKIYHVNNKVYLKIDGIVYTIEPCTEGCPFKTETDNSITEFIINQG